MNQVIDSWKFSCKFYKYIEIKRHNVNKQRRIQKENEKMAQDEHSEEEQC